MNKAIQKPSTQSIRISLSTHHKLKEFAAKNGLKYIDMTSRCLERALENSPDYFLP